MNVRVKSCHNCIFHKVRETVQCRLTGDTIQGAEGNNGPNHVFEQTMPRNCPLLDGAVTVSLDLQTEFPNHAFVGYRIQLKDGRKGIVCAKWTPTKEDKENRLFLKDNPDAGGEPIYMVLFDGGENIHYAYQRQIKHILAYAPKFNYNQAFEYVFGFGEDTDVTPE